MEENKEPSGEMSKKETRCQCPFCDEPICPDQADSCYHCRVEVRICPVCRAPMERTASVCGSCGASVS